MKLVSILVVLAIAAGVLFLIIWMGKPAGAVSMFLISPQGSRQVGDYSLRTGSFSARSDIDASALSIENISSDFGLSDGSVITVAPSGIVKRMGDDTAHDSLLVATPIAALSKAPLAVWGEATRLAWINPADHSLQVFERNSRGTYLPIYLNNDFKVNSIGFTEDGSILVFTRLVVGKEEGSVTEVYAVNLNNSGVNHIDTIDGFATIIAP